jgi:hypothetical protein
VGSGFISDDLNLVLLMEGKISGQKHGIDLYKFLDGTPQTLRPLIERGPFPWWTSPNFKLAFFRPLGSMLLMADHAMFGRNASGYHVHSLLWYVLLCALVAFLYRRTLPPKIATLALFMFVVNQSHVEAVGWIANRHSMVATVFALLGFLAHLRARTQGWRPGWVLSCLSIGVGLQSSEAAIGVMAYLAAYELFGRTDALGQRIRALVPYVLLLGGYLLYYRHFGYGTAHSGAYIDPIGNPRSFLGVAPSRLCLLLGSFLAGPPSDLVLGKPALVPVLVCLGVFVSALIIWQLRAAGPTLTQEHALALRWLSAGAVLSLVPSLGAMPGDRLLLGFSVGGVPVMASVLALAAKNRGFFGRAALLLFILLFGVRPPLIRAAGSAVFSSIDKSLRQELKAAELPEQPSYNIVLLAVSDPMLAITPPTMRVFDTGAEFRSWWILSMAPRSHTVMRSGLDTLELSVDTGTLLDAPYAALFSDLQQRYHVGDVISLSGAWLRVESERSGHPTRVSVRFNRPLDDPSLFFVTQQNGSLRKVTLPEAGQPLRLPYSPGPSER